MRYKDYEPKRDTFYILYDVNDYPVFYADTLKEFSRYFNRSYDHLKCSFVKAKSLKFIHLLIDKKDYFLYKFSDKELVNVTL